MKGTPLRSLCDDMAKAFRVPSVIPHASRLVRGGWIPGRNSPVGSFSAALLMAGVLAAPLNPAKAIDAVLVLAAAPLSLLREERASGEGIQSRDISTLGFSETYPTGIALIESFLIGRSDTLFFLRVLEGGRGLECKFRSTNFPPGSALIAVYCAPNFATEGVQHDTLIGQAELAPLIRHFTPDSRSAAHLLAAWKPESAAAH